MKINTLLPYVIISLIAFVSRLPLIEKFQSHWDGPDYSIAIIRYSLAQHTPTAPGYPLYIASGKFLNLFINDPHLSILMISVVASIIGALAFYTYGAKIYNKYVGVVASTIFLTASPFYYFSLTPYGYLLTMSFITLLAYICYRVFILKKNDGAIYGVILGILFGIRPQEMLLIGPLALLGFIFLNRKNKIYASLIFIAITLLWLIPLIRDSGGINNYVSLNLASASAEGFTHTFSYNLPLAIKGLLLSYGISIFFLIFYPYSYIYKKIKINKKVVVFYLFWIMPGVIYNLFVRGEHAGYQISYLSSLLILISYAIWSSTKKRMPLFYLSVFIIAIFNLFWFFYNRDPKFVKPFRPTSFHYTDIRKNDIIIGNKVNYVKENFDPNKTLLVSTEAAWRPYSYYLKDFQIIVPFALDNKEIPYIYNKITGKNWDITRTKTKEFSFKIPDKINTIILMDSLMNTWITDNQHEVVNLPGNSRITILPIKKDSTLIYNYHLIRIKN